MKATFLDLFARNIFANIQIADQLHYAEAAFPYLYHRSELAFESPFHK